MLAKAKVPAEMSNQVNASGEAAIGKAAGAPGQLGYCNTPRNDPGPAGGYSSSDMPPGEHTHVEAHVSTRKVWTCITKTLLLGAGHREMPSRDHNNQPLHKARFQVAHIMNVIVHSTTC